jgi:hypothetical protein
MATVQNKKRGIYFPIVQRPSAISSAFSSALSKTSEASSSSSSFLSGMELLADARAITADRS